LAKLSRQSASSRPRSGAEAFWNFQLRGFKKLADELAALVRQGIKTATCSALMGYEKDETPLPQKGDLSIVLDGNGNPVLVIETVSVVILPFNEVSEQFAFEEGEGDRSLAYWLTRAIFAVITLRVERSTRRCWLFANGSRSSTQSIDLRGLR